MGNPGEAVLYDSEHDNTKPKSKDQDVNRGVIDYVGEVPRDDCQVPCQRPAIDNFWRCGCFQSDGGEMEVFTPPAWSMPDTSYHPVKMGKTTLISDPVYAFPISIDQLVAAAIATRRALFVSRFVRWTLERSEWPSARKASVVFDPVIPVWNDVFEREVRRQHKLVCKIGEYPVDSDAEIESGGNEIDPWINGLRRDWYDIRTFREIHAMLHAAYDDAHGGWLLVRNDEGIFTEEDQEPYHGDRCPRHDPCESHGPRYWDEMCDYWWDYLDHYEEDRDHRIWLKRLQKDLDEQQVWEMKSWRDKLIGENGRHSWIQENVIKVLEVAFKGLSITIINATVLHDDEKHEVDSRGIRNFIPMAWVHLNTKWKSTTNAPYVKPINSTGESEADDIRCHQGYAPVIPGDPGHWYSNAARDAPENRSGEPSSAEAAPLMKFCKLFELPAWLHNLQYLPRAYENADQDGGPGSKKSKKNNTGSKDNESGSSKPSVTLDKGLIYHHAGDIGDFGDKKKWPAVVELRKVVHKDGEGEGKQTDGQHAVDWEHWNTSNPKLEDDLDRPENNGYIKHVQGHLDRISKDNPPLDEGGKNQHEQYRSDLDNIGTALQTILTGLDKDLVSNLRKQIVKLQRGEDEAERITKELQAKVKSLELKNARLEVEVKKLSLSAKRQKPETGSKPKKDDDEDDQPPKKKQKTNEPVDKGKGKAKEPTTKKNTSGSSPSKKQTAAQNDTDSPILIQNPWDSKSSGLSNDKSPAKAPAGKTTTATTKGTTKAPDKAGTNADADSSTTTRKSPKRPDIEPFIRPARSVSSSRAVSSPAPAPSSSPNKPKAKPKLTKAPAKVSAEAPAKKPAKAPAKTPAKKPAAAAAAAPKVATASPASTASQPTRTSRRQKKEDVELKRVSDPEKAAKKGRKAG